MVNEGYAYGFDFKLPHLVFNLFPFLHPVAFSHARFGFNYFHFRALAPPGFFALAVFCGAPPGGAPRLRDAGGAAHGGRPARPAHAFRKRSVRFLRAPYRALTPVGRVCRSLCRLRGVLALSLLVSLPAGRAARLLPWFGLRARPWIRLVGSLPPAFPFRGVYNSSRRVTRPSVTTFLGCCRPYPKPGRALPFYPAC